MRHLESNLQQGCVKWFRLQYPHLAKLLVAVPNGGYRNAREAGRMKAEGIVPGASDLLLLVPRNGYGCLGIEMKAGPGRQTTSQKQWQERFEAGGNKYVLCRNAEEFVNEVRKYLNNNSINI